MAERPIWTAEALDALTVVGPVEYRDGRNGKAAQVYACAAEPRFGAMWRQENRDDPGRSFWTVDGQEVADLEEAAERMNRPPEVI